MSTFRLSVQQAAFIYRLWELSPPEAKFPAISINMETGFRTKYHDKHEDAPWSPYFLNLRTSENPKQGPLQEPEIMVAVQIFLGIIDYNQLRPTHVAGIPNAGTPFGRMLADHLGVPHLELVKGTHSDGKRAIVGIRDCPDFSEHGTGRVLIVDDVMSEADTKLEVLELEGWDQAELHLAVLVDRQQGGREALRASGRLKGVYAGMTITQVMFFLEARGKISRAKRDAVLAYPAILHDFKVGKRLI